MKIYTGPGALQVSRALAVIDQAEHEIAMDLGHQGPAQAGAKPARDSWPTISGGLLAWMARASGHQIVEIGGDHHLMLGLVDDFRQQRIAKIGLSPFHQLLEGGKAAIWIPAETLFKDLRIVLGDGLLGQNGDTRSAGG